MDCKLYVTMGYKCGGVKNRIEIVADDGEAPINRCAPYETKKCDCFLKLK